MQQVAASKNKTTPTKQKAVLAEASFFKETGSVTNAKEPGSKHGLNRLMIWFTEAYVFSLAYGLLI